MLVNTLFIELNIPVTIAHKHKICLNIVTEVLQSIAKLDYKINFFLQKKPS